MFLWFIACGVLFVALVFDSGGFDYRFVVVGAVLPLAENLSGSPWIMHTLAGSVALLAAVMIATAGRGRRLARRRWLGLPVGTLVFLVASGAWMRRALFWWPFGGEGGAGHSVAPELARPVGLIIALEAVGAVALLWVWIRYGLSQSERRWALLNSGRLTPRRRRAPGRGAP